MNKIPSILVNTGFPVDQNGALTEIVIPAVVSILNAPRKVTFLGETLNYIPSTAAALQEFEAPNCVSVPANFFMSNTALNRVSLNSLTSAISSTSTPKGKSGLFFGLTALTSISFNSLSSVSDTAGASQATSGMFYGCTGLTSISLPSLSSVYALAEDAGSAGMFYNCTGMTSILLPALSSVTNVQYYSGKCGLFYGCTSLTSVSLPALTTISENAQNGNTNAIAGTFANCTGLTNVALPALVSCSGSVQYTSTFYNCTNLESVQIGSVGHAVKSLGSYMFRNCIQSNLTITIYTNGGAALAGEPWGATNADIEYEEA